MMGSPQRAKADACTGRRRFWSHRWMRIVWPAFLVAAVLEMVVFAVVDPSNLHWFGQPVSLSSEAVYTLAFFVFWGTTMASSALTTLLAMSPSEVNH
jgi:polyferredoxin